MGRVGQGLRPFMRTQCHEQLGSGVSSRLTHMGKLTRRRKYGRSGSQCLADGASPEHHQVEPGVSLIWVKKATYCI